jgi:hypothetical protein
MHRQGIEKVSPSFNKERFFDQSRSVSQSGPYRINVQVNSRLRLCVDVVRGRVQRADARNGGANSRRGLILRVSVGFLVPIGIRGPFKLPYGFSDGSGDFGQPVPPSEKHNDGPGHQEHFRPADGTNHLIRIPSKKINSCINIIDQRKRATSERVQVGLIPPLRSGFLENFSRSAGRTRPGICSAGG